jgi:protein-S-isoprenylcysteine O-methyltransferase Ste14
MRVTAARESGRQIGDFQLTKKENRIINAVFLPMIIAFIYAVFLPLKSGTAWLYTGLIIYLFGVVFTIVTILNFATSAKDKVITRGLYSFSRNPMYISMLLMYIGVGVACSSWLFLLFILVLAVLLNANLPAEERYCFHIYGDDYKKYTNRTPRWIGTPKS